MRMMTFVSLAILGFVLGCPDEKGCRACSISPTCALCYDAFLSPEKQCKSVSKFIDNCEVYSPANNGESCDFCVPGFFAANDGKVCRPCKDANCASCNATGETCLACFGSYGIKSGACVTANDKKDKNCFVANPNGECTRCMIGFALDVTNRCTPAAAACKRVGTDRVSCVMCHDGTSITSHGSCEGVQRFLPYELGYLKIFIYIIVGISFLSMLGCCCCCFLCIKAGRRRNEDYHTVPPALN